MSQWKCSPGSEEVPSCSLIRLIQFVYSSSCDCHVAESHLEGKNKENAFIFLLNKYIAFLFVTSCYRNLSPCTHKKSKRNQCSNLYTAPITKPTLELLRVLHLLCPVLAALLCLESSPAEVPQGPAAEVLAALRRAPPTGKSDPASRGPKELAIRP